MDRNSFNHESLYQQYEEFGVKKLTLERYKELINENIDDEKAKANIDSLYQLSVIAFTIMTELKNK